MCSFQLSFIFKYYVSIVSYFVFFFNDTATTEIYTLSLHDALPICLQVERAVLVERGDHRSEQPAEPSFLHRLPPLPNEPCRIDRKSTRLNSSHANISYAVFCLKKKKNTEYTYSERITKTSTQFYMR